MAKLVPSLVHPLKSRFFSNRHTLLTKHSFNLNGVQVQPRLSYSSSSTKISMSLKAGIVGLPNVGKSTLFNAVVSHTVISLSLFLWFFIWVQKLWFFFFVWVFGVTWNKWFSFIQFWVSGCLRIFHKLFVFFDRSLFEKMTDF